MPAIETEYRGHLFRSRLEARWAAFFDLIGMKWVYEPIDADGYIPDFEIPGPMLIEVKPASTLAELQQHRTRLEGALRRISRPIVVVGNTPVIWSQGAPLVGWAGTRNSYGGWVWDMLIWGVDSAGVVRWVPANDIRRGAYKAIAPNVVSRIEYQWGIAHQETRWTPGP